jgi:hypothetical protein
LHLLLLITYSVGSSQEIRRSRGGGAVAGGAGTVESINPCSNRSLLHYPAGKKDFWLAFDIGSFADVFRVDQLLALRMLFHVLGTCSKEIHPASVSGDKT